MSAEENNPYVMPDAETVSDFSNLDPGVYSGTLIDFGVSESHPIVFMVVKPEAELTLQDPNHKKSKSKNWTRYEPQNLKCIKKMDGEDTYRISLFLGNEISRYPQYYRNDKGELKKTSQDKDLPKDAKLLTQREEVLIELSRLFNLAGKEIPHPDGAGFLECLAVFLDKEVAGRKVVFQAKNNGEYTNYFVKAAVTEEQLKAIKGY